MAQQARAFRTEIADNQHADSIAQAALCAAPILAAAKNSAAALGWLRPQLQDWEQAALDKAKELSTQDSVLSTHIQPSHLYDTFLHHYARASRKHRGVFFTPQAVAEYIVAQIDRLLREECGFDDGLADQRVTIIDPACGTGVFLLAAIRFLCNKLANRRSVENLLSRLIGVEILPPAALLSKLNITLQFADNGYNFHDAQPITILTADAVSPDIQSKIQNPKSKLFPVLIGNPPFSSLSTNSNPWITRLVRGDDEIRGYVRANGQQLGERKTWLHDDYVKFIRLAQWHVEQADQGVVGFVTNHGYLDNATFRLMRHELLHVFPYIEILDLHGNRKKHETASGGIRDENVFGLDQGIAISLMCRPPTLVRGASEGKMPSNVAYSDLWGSRKEKLDVLAAEAQSPGQSCLPSLALRANAIDPQAPNWRFVPVVSAATCAKYASAWSLADAMPVHTTAPVTARDHFVIAFTRDELITRVEEFRNLEIPDEEIRERYFHRTRSTRYQTGDTRGWKLSKARRIIAADSNWQEKVIRCLYRPFDWRYVFWHPAMIDWPRMEVTRQLITKNQEPRTNQLPNPKIQLPNLCLIARRQQLPTQPCTFFWISDCLAIDGVIRSDNRGSESLFPLYVDQQANFATAFIDQISAATRLTWNITRRGDLTKTFGPEDLLGYIYAQFHSPNYREKYAEQLRGNFPRIVPPHTAEQFLRMARLGSELIDLDLLRNCNRDVSPLAALSASVGSFRAGGYPALKKWLQPKHRSAKDIDYQRIAMAIARTLEIMEEIDK